MKKAALVVAIVFLFSASSLFAAEPSVDSERAAQALAQIIRKVKTLNGTFSFVQHEGNTVQLKYGKIVALTDGILSYLLIGTREIVVDGKFTDPNKVTQIPKGIPEEELTGATSFRLTVWGRDEYGRAWVYGEFQKGFIAPGDPIIVTLRPVPQEQMVEFTLPDGTNPDDLSLRIQGNGLFGIGEYNWPYDPSVGGFRAWLDPLFIHQYQIVNVSLGVVVDFGTLDPLKGTEGVVSVRQHILNRALIGNVVEVPFSPERGYVYLPQQSFDGEVVRCEESPCDPEADRFPSKVFFAHMDGQALRVTSFSSRDVLVEIYELRSDRSLVLLARSSGLITIAEAPAGKAILLISIVSVGATPEDRFFIEFVRSGGGYGVGKG